MEIFQHFLRCIGFLFRHTSISCNCFDITQQILFATLCCTANKITCADAALLPFLFCAYLLLDETKEISKTKLCTN